MRSAFLPLILAFTVTLAVAQQKTAPQAQTPPKPGQTPTVATSPAVQAPTSKHYPILVIAEGTNPTWSLRLGMKGPERLDRANYPPIILIPAEITPDDSGKIWLYHAKDDATSADVTVKLTRESCADPATPDVKSTFSVEVNHAQIGQLKGCGQSTPNKFPEFLKKNQIDDAESLEAANKPKDPQSAKDQEKFKVLDPITKFTAPTAIAYLDAAGKLIVAHGQVKKIAAPSGALEPALSHDGKRLLYTRSDSKTGPERTIVLYDFDSGRSRDLAGGNVRQAFWSPDDSRVAFLKFDNNSWQLWTLPAAAPEKAAALSTLNFASLQGWVSANSILATDAQNAYWIGDDGKPTQTVPLPDIYGTTFEIMSSDTLRSHPLNPDLLLVSAYYATAPAGAPSDSMSLNSTFFLYEIRSKRRVVLGPPDGFARGAEWSRDGLQIFFTLGVPVRQPLVTDRLFWDGTTLRRYVAASNLVIGK